MEASRVCERRIGVHSARGSARSPRPSGRACGLGSRPRGSRLQRRAALDLGAEVGEQGLERAAAGKAGRPDRTPRRAGASLGGPRGRTATDLGHAGRSIPTSAAHGTACPSDQGVGGRGGHAVTFAFCSLLSMIERAKAIDRSKYWRRDRLAAPCRIARASARLARDPGSSVHDRDPALGDQPDGLGNQPAFEGLDPLGQTVGRVVLADRHRVL